MLVKSLLRSLNLGNSVAEHDELLEEYFIETEPFRRLIQDQDDTVAGDKGTGKTALYRILRKRYTGFPELDDTEVLAGFNPTGNPVFQRLAEGEAMEEGQYVTIWKAYFLSLVGNYILQLNEGAFSHKMEELDGLLKRTGLDSADDSARTIFQKVVNLVRRLSNPESVEVTATITAEGIPVAVPKATFPDEVPAHIDLVRHDDALRLLNDVLEETAVNVWIVLDRLDEAFQGFPDAEVPALRALLRTYLDLADFERLRLKLFIRKDLFGRIIGDGFVNLTHVNARKMEIVWDDEDLFDLLCERLRKNPEVVAALEVTDETPNEELFARVFPPQVDPGTRKPTTWNWLLARIRDGNGIKPPRNLIDLATNARDAQLRQEARAERQYQEGQPLIQPDAIKRGFAALSQERVEDTLLAEAGFLAPLIEHFRDGRAEHNEHSLADVLDIPKDEVRTAIKPLLTLGFLEETGATFKVPMIYRGGLSITQGKAFVPENGGAGDEEEEYVPSESEDAVSGAEDSASGA